MNLDGEPAVPTSFRLYGERIIHAAIYAARPDVMAICHHHAPSVLPYAIARVELKPVYHLGALMGPKVPYWDSRDEFGDTALVVVTPEEGRSLAKALGPYWMILMGRHGATVAGASLREMVFRTIFSARNAELQTQAKLVGGVNPLSPAEAAKAAAYNLRPAPMERAWDYWAMRLAKKEGRDAAAVRKTGARARREGEEAAEAEKASVARMEGAPLARPQSGDTLPVYRGYAYSSRPGPGLRDREERSLHPGYKPPPRLRMRNTSTSSRRALSCKLVAGLAHQVGDVDLGERIGAFDHERRAGRQPRQRLAGAQRRQRAFEPAQVDGGFAGCGLVHVRLFQSIGSEVRQGYPQLLLDRAPAAPPHIRDGCSPGKSPAHRTPDAARGRVARGSANASRRSMPREMRAAAALGATLAQDIVVADRAAGGAAGPDRRLGGARRGDRRCRRLCARSCCRTRARSRSAKRCRPRCDAVAPLDAVTWRGGMAKLHAAGDGGRRRADARRPMPARAKCCAAPAHRLRAIDVAAMQALGIARRAGAQAARSGRARRPRPRRHRATPPRTGSPTRSRRTAASRWLSRPGPAGGSRCSPAGGVDAVVIVGGTGAGPRDHAVHALARIGTVEAHGIAVSPGETAAFGIAEFAAGAAGSGPPRCGRRGVAADRPRHAGAAARRHRG